MDKKINAMYWDEIDWLTEEYVEKLIEMSIPSITIDEDDIMPLAKGITDFATEYLEKEVGANFPYVDEDF